MALYSNFHWHTFCYNNFHARVLARHLHSPQAGGLRKSRRLIPSLSKTLGRIFQEFPRSSWFFIGRNFQKFLRFAGQLRSLFYLRKSFKIGLIHTTIAHKIIIAKTNWGIYPISCGATGLDLSKGHQYSSSLPITHPIPKLTTNIINWSILLVLQIGGPYMISLSFLSTIIHITFRSIYIHTTHTTYTY